MTDVEKHLETTLKVDIFQIAELFDSCSAITKIKIISAIVNGDVGNWEKDEDIIMTIEDVGSLFSEATDDQRMELIKSIIWTSEDMFKFHKKADEMIRSNEFQETLD